MKRYTKLNLLLMTGAFVVGLVGAILFFREPTEPLTEEALSSARSLWQAAGILDYDLRFRMHGSTYEVTVRDGVVTELIVNGQRSSTAEPQAYTVEGLFDTLAMELDSLDDPQGPFAGPQVVLMRVRFNNRYGYVERYLRSGAGARRGVAIELLEFNPITPE